MHMINQPPLRVNSYEDCRVPVPLADTACSIQLKKDYEIREVWCTTPEPRLKIEKLNFKKEGERIHFSVPKLRFWNMIVLKMKGPAK